MLKRILILTIAAAMMTLAMAADSKDELNILNVRSFPVVGGNWVVKFTTYGRADLIVEAVEGTFFEPAPEGETPDFKFLTLKCGNKEKKPVKEGNKYIYPDWSGDEFGLFDSLVLTPGEHHLKFTFGKQVAYAHNTTGDFQWSERLGGSGYDYGRAVTTDTNNNVIVAGNVQGTADLNGDGDTTDTNETTAFPYGGYDIFISKFEGEAPAGGDGGGTPNNK